MANSCFVLGQNYPFTNISMTNGLPNNQVEAILKDSRGILWVGTNNGLCKIENGEIINFFKQDGLAHNSTWTIIEDSKTNLWFGSYGGGVTHYNGKKFKVFNVENGLVNNFVRKLFQYKNFVFVGTQNGLSVINIENNSLSTYKTNNTIENDKEINFQVMDFFVYKDELYCGTFKKGIFKVDVENKSVHKVYDYENESIDALFSIYTKDSVLYYSVDGANNSKSEGALKKFKIENLLNSKKEDLRFGKSIIWEYATDSENNLYGAGWGVYSNIGGLYEIKNDDFIERTVDFGIASTSVQCLYYDKEYNRLYAGTTDVGFYIIDLDKKILYFKNTDQNILDIEFFDEKVFLLTTKGLNVLNQDKVIKHVPNSEFLKNSISLDEEQKKLIKYKAENIVFYDIDFYDSSIWISSNIGLYQLNSKGDILKHYNFNVYKFIFDNNNSLINTIPYTSLFLYSNLENSVYTEFDGLDVNTPVNITSFKKYEDRIYIGTEHKGLFVYENGQFISLNQLDKFDQLEIKHLSLINKDVLVIATTAGEIYLVDVKNDFKVLEIIDKELINGNSILFLQTYKDHILIGTNRGLTIYKGGNVQWVDEEQGLVDIGFTTSKIINDKLIIGTHYGYYSIDLTEFINIKNDKLQAKLSTIQVNQKKDTRIENKWFNLKTSNIEYSYDENLLDIDFKVTNHPYPKKLHYSYQINDLDSIWSKFTSIPKIHLQYLPIGKYTINLRIKDLSSGSISLSKLAVITIKPPFWKTWWFISALAVIGVFIIMLAYIKRINFIKDTERQKAEVEKRNLEIKLEALQSQMNPHFTYNAMNSIQNYIIDNDIDNALMYMAEFAKLIRKTLDNSTQRLISLSEEISYLQSYIMLENMRFNNRVAVSIKHEHLDTAHIMIPPMLIQPFVENVFVHAFTKEKKNPNLEINFFIKNKFLFSEIKDNGRGFSKTISGQLHESKGINLVRERLKLLNGKSKSPITITSEIEKGTIILLQLEKVEFNG